jgi:hypothetical protein
MADEAVECLICGDPVPRHDDHAYMVRVIFEDENPEKPTMGLLCDTCGEEMGYPPIDLKRLRQREIN